MVSTFTRSLAAVEPGAGPYAFDSSSEVLDVASESLQRRDTLATTAGTGSGRHVRIEAARVVKRETGGRLILNPSPSLLGNWLPRILGGAAVGDVFPLAQSLPAFGVMVDRVAQVFVHQQCYVAQATLRGAAGRLLELEMLVAGVDSSSQAAGSFPSLSAGAAVADQPYAMADVTLTMAGAVRDCSAFELTIDNQLQARFAHSVTATGILPQGRSIRLKTVHAFDASHTSLLDQAATGAAGSMALVHPAGTTTFSFARLQTPAAGPSMATGGRRGRKEFVLELHSLAAADGSTAGLEVTHSV